MSPYMREEKGKRKPFSYINNFKASFNIIN
jgi:hypothetical protein